MSIFSDLSNIEVTISRVLNVGQGKQSLKVIHIRNLEDEVAKVGQDLIIKDLKAQK